ncbi:MAG TPA: outer membrane beta-barrel protein [Steroidobacteraceae bacterium]|nr:outer membrane beta-barrel protein [Steroidobacteraceae bacterium]
MRNRLSAAVIPQACRELRKFATTGVSGLAAFLSCIAVSTSAQAQERIHSNTFEITPFVGFMAGGSFEDPTDGAERDVEDDSNFGIFLNLVADVPERHYELLYTQQSTVVEGDIPLDLDLQYLQIGGTVGYPQNRYVTPYFGMTVGGSRFTPDMSGLDDELKLSFSVGGGMKFPITDHFGIRLDVRGFITLLGSDSEIFCVSDPANVSGCLIRTKSDTFVQYTGSLGFIVGF